MRLLIVTQKVDKADPALGFFHRWIEEFSKHVEIVHVICLYEGAHTLPKNVFIHSLGKENRLSKMQYVLRLYSYVWKYRGEYDAVFVHMNPIYVVLCGILWRLMGKRIGMWYTHKSVDLKLRLATMLMHKAFSGSPESYRIKTPKLTVTGQGVDPTFFSYKEKINVEAPTLLVVSRISRVKNIELAIDTLQYVKDSLNACLVIVGAPITDDDKKYEHEMHVYAAEIGLERQVTWLGGKDAEGVRNALQNADIFLHTSLTHSADKTLPEAMATGLLVITSSEAYERDVPEICLQKPSAESYGKAILSLRSLSVVERDKLRDKLRERVLKCHSLRSLILKIVNLLESK